LRQSSSTRRKKKKEEPMLWLHSCLPFLFFLFPFSFAQTTCIHTVGNVKYDLTQLSRPGSQWTLPQTMIQPWSFDLNICAPIADNKCGEGVAGCQYWSSGQASIGLAKSQIWGPLSGENAKKEGVTLSFTGGIEDRSCEIDIICDPKAGLGEPVWVDEKPGKHYNFKWTTSVPCSKKHSSSSGSSLSPGSIIDIIVVCALAAYFVGGVLFKKFKMKAEGIELIPNVRFWAELPGLVRDGAKFIINKTCRRGYQKL